MQKILIRRSFRDLKANAFRYMALSLLIIFSVYLIVSLVSAADTVVVGGEAAARAQHIEDGEFSVFAPLTSAQTDTIQAAGVTLEAMFYMDMVGNQNPGNSASV